MRKGQDHIEVTWFDGVSRMTQPDPIAEAPTWKKKIRGERGSSEDAEVRRVGDAFQVMPGRSSSPVAGSDPCAPFPRHVRHVCVCHRGSERGERHNGGC